MLLFFQDGNDPNNFEAILDQSGRLLRGGDLMVHNVQAEDAGIYFCFAKTNSGHTVATFHLSVLRESEVILQEPKNVTLEVGQSAYFTCKSHEKLTSESTSWVKIEEDIIVLSEGNVQNHTKVHINSKMHVVQIFGIFYQGSSSRF